MISATPRTISFVDASCRMWPSRFVVSQRSCGSATSSAVTTTGPVGREPVERLAARPLRLAELQVACRDVVDDRVAPHVVERVAHVHATGGPADDHAELGLVVDLRREVLGPRGRGAVPGERVRPQREDGHRRLGAQLQLRGVRGVVGADRDAPARGAAPPMSGAARRPARARRRAASAASTTSRTCGEAVGPAFDELLEVARRLGHDLVEEECRLRHHHREPRGRLAFDSEVRELHRSRLSGRRPARDLCMAYNERCI